MERTLILNIESAIRGIKMGTKKPEDVGTAVATNMTKLKLLNEGMQIDLMVKYKQVVEGYKNSLK
jgi:hypothetical protein